jgi:hypothetical protein
MGPGIRFDPRGPPCGQVQARRDRRRTAAKRVRLQLAQADLQLTSPAEAQRAVDDARGTHL